MAVCHSFLLVASLFYVLILKAIGPFVAGYYLRQGPGQWLGDGAARLGLSGPVEAADLTAVLRGCDPSKGSFLPQARSSRRRSGWDLVFAAPKSLSLFVATAPGGGGPVMAAHHVAVTDVVAHVQGQVEREIVAATFDHTVNAASEPHLHSHVLLANLAGAGDGWTALATWLHRDELASLYHLGLRHHLERAAIPLRWRIRPEGLPDLVAVPRAAVRAASTRGHESRVGGSFVGRLSGTRDWRPPAADAGWTETNASKLVEQSESALLHEHSAASNLRDQVASHLLTTGSSFTARDVIVALGRSSTGGFQANAAASWAKNFCHDAVPVEVGPGAKRWTTPLAQTADRRLEQMVRQRGQDRFDRLIDPDLPSAVRSEAELVGRAAESFDSIVRSRSLAVMTAPPGDSSFLSHATIAAACASVWEASGITVAFATRSAPAQARWEALTGIETFHSSRRPHVILVDQAERRPPGELMGLLSLAPDSRLVFLEGGSLPRARTNASLGYSRVATACLNLESGPPPKWYAKSAEAGVSRFTGSVAGQVIGRWADAFASPLHSSRSGGLPVMVGLGVPEIVAMNEAGRRHLVAAGSIGGRSISAWGRSFQEGDRVVAFGKGANGIRAGMSGTILSVDARGRTVTVGWPIGRLDMSRQMLQRIGHGYAVTPRLASRTEGPVFLLGGSERLGLDRSRIAAEVTVERHGQTLERERGRVAEVNHRAAWVAL